MPLMPHILSNVSNSRTARNAAGFTGAAPHEHDSPRKMTFRSPSSVSSASTSSNSSGITCASSSSCSSNEWNQDISLREIYKSGKLKLLHPERKLFSWPRLEKHREEPYYCLFCIHEEVNPFLELYEDHKSSLSHKPVKVIPLGQCQHVSPNIDPTQQVHSFTLTLSNESMQLAASSAEDCKDWISTLRSQIHQLQSFDSDKNAYTKCPVLPKSERLLSTPMLNSSPSPIHSPIPEISRSETSRSSSRLSDKEKKRPENLSASHHLIMPVVEPALSSPPAFLAPPVPVQEPAKSLDISSVPPPIPPRGVKPMRPVPHPLLSSQLPPPPPPPREDADTARNRALPVPPSDSLAAPAPRPLPAKWKDESDFCDVGALLRDASWKLRTGPALLISCEDKLDRRDKERETQANASLFQRRSGNNSNNINNKSSQVIARSSTRDAAGGGGRERRSPAPVLNSSSRRETRSQTASPALSDRSVSSTVSEPSPSAMDEHSFFASWSALSPIPSSHNTQHSKERTLTLRQQQVAKLKQEMLDPLGIRVKLRRKDCLSSIALVDYFGCVWIAGWKQREHPDFHSRFRLGDQLVSVNGIFVAKASDAMRLIQDAPTQRSVIFQLNRVPRGKVLLLEREFDGQDLGLVLENKTAEIRSVVPGGLADKHKLSAKAMTCDGSTLCNWVLTEINHRPLNWYFKDSEIDDRLRAVGKEISILVQPSDLINGIKKQLKSMRNYKDYLVQ